MFKKRRLKAEFNGLISMNTKENIEKMLYGEISANKGQRLSAIRAKEANVDEAHDLFNESSRQGTRQDTQ